MSSPGRTAAALRAFDKSVKSYSFGIPKIIFIVHENRGKCNNINQLISKNLSILYNVFDFVRFLDNMTKFRTESAGFPYKKPWKIPPFFK